MLRVCLFDLWLVVGNQERRIQYKTKLSKEDFRQRRDNSEKQSRPLGNGVRKGFTLYSIYRLSVGLVI